MIKINMFSSADKVKGQGVGSAYLELINMLKKTSDNQFDITINQSGTADITHYHTIDPKFYVSTFSKQRGKKIGYVHFLPETLEGSLKIPQPFRNIFYKYVISFYKRMDHLVVVNPTFIPKLVAYGIDKNKITYIPNFVSTDEFYAVDDATKNQLRQEMGFSKDQFIVLGSGQVQTRKGVLDFVKLAKANPDVQFIWTGGFSFGKMTDGYKELEKVVKNPPKNLSFPGIVDRDKLVKYYNIADLFLLPSYNELFPMSVLEAFSTHTPVMLRDLDLYKSIIDGYYLPAKDFLEMDYQIKLLSRDKSKLETLEEKSKQAANQYSEEHLSTVWKKFYTKQIRND
ncbi:glycosyltransferase family 4 protein [Lentilactobacillus laojiaonis]|uniref:glycosyltransferase family 4 protein n=1 Tax=Lentilactobacillus laojiaonis TaxID=2883998 RepID=UPI001D0AC79F|nr:glycosyltransferase family 4 protein [Lentilactobacillus laojiaonis]UDM32448.1 glycosyltransferase family 4 protein [Lentilactobacillus laojiaonis]